MQLYSAKIRLAGSLFNEVVKTDLTAPEITVLRTIHGADAVVEIKPGKQIDRSDSDERARLEQTYGRALLTIETVKTLAALIGPEGVPLAKSVSGVDSLPPPKAGRPKKAETEPDPEPELLPAEAAQFT